MNGIDHADQLRGYYISQRRSPHTWRPLWYFLLDTTVCNAYQLSAKCDPGAGRHRPHFAFTEQLAYQLCERSISLSDRNYLVAAPPAPSRTLLQDKVRPIMRLEHGLRATKLSNTDKSCVAYESDGRTVSMAKRAKQRKAFDNLSPFSI